MILLDTCVLFWLEQDPGRISEPAKQAIARSTTALFASSISALELALKVGRGWMQLPMPPAAWLREVCLRREIRELPIDFEVAALSALLPPVHKDPFDRILIATAVRHSLTIITLDQMICRYPNLRTLW